MTTWIDEKLREEYYKNNSISITSEENKVFLEKLENTRFHDVLLQIRDKIGGKITIDEAIEIFKNKNRFLTIKN